MLVIGLFGFSTGHIKIAIRKSKIKSATIMMVGQSSTHLYKNKTAKKQREKTALQLKYVLA